MRAVRGRVIPGEFMVPIGTRRRSMLGYLQFVGGSGSPWWLQAWKAVI